MPSLANAGTRKAMCFLTMLARTAANGRSTSWMLEGKELAFIHWGGGNSGTAFTQLSCPRTKLCSMGQVMVSLSCPMFRDFGLQHHFLKLSFDEGRICNLWFGEFYELDDAVIASSAGSWP